MKKNYKHSKDWLTITSPEPLKSGSFVYWKSPTFFFFEKGLRIVGTKLAVGSLSISLNSPTKNNFILKHTHRRKYSKNENHVINIWKYKKEKSSSANLPNENKKRRPK